MKFTIHQGSRQGPRPYNQDRLAYSYSKEALLLVVADGLGGHRHGEIAAQVAVKTLTDAFQEAATPALANPAQFLKKNIMEIHDAIDSLAITEGLLETPRTTIVAAILQRNKLYCAHVGDSRLYHFRDHELLFRTEDHSLVQMLYNKGQLDQADMLTHPQRNKIYNCLGGDARPKIDLAPPRKLKDGDILLLCTDGLWSTLSDERMSQILHGGFMSYAVPDMLDEAELLSDEHGDNISAIGLQWSERQDNRLAVSTVTMPLSATTTIMNPVTFQQMSPEQVPADLTDDEIENAIAEIQMALRKTER